MAMFDETLLERSSTSLKPIHWAIILAAAAFGYLLGYKGSTLVFSGLDTGALLTYAVTLAVALGFYAWMLCYAWVDAQRAGLNPVTWLIIVALLNIIGLIIYLLYSAAKTSEWKGATRMLAFLFEALVCGAIVLYPLIYTQALPQTQLMTTLLAPPPPPPPPPPPAPPAPKVVIHRVTAEELMRAPTEIPKTIQEVKDQPQPPQAAGVVGGVPGGVPGGSMAGVIGGIGAVPPPPPPPKPATPKRIRVGGQVELAKQIFAPAPEYPQIAKMARVQGVVRLAAIISENGTIQDLKLISGPPLLVKAAMDAVSRWRYQPTLLNGEPVQVDTEIDVNFTLQGE